MLVLNDLLVNSDLCIYPVYTLSIIPCLYPVYKSTPHNSNVSLFEKSLNGIVKSPNNWKVHYFEFFAPLPNYREFGIL